MIEKLVEKHIQYMIRLYRKQHMDKMGKIDDNGYYTANKGTFMAVSKYYHYKKFFKIFRRVARKIARIARIDPILAEKYRDEDSIELITMRRIHKIGGNTNVDDA